MAKEIRELQMPNGKRVFVEVELTDVDMDISSNSSEQTGDLPPGAEPVGIIDDALIGMKLFQENIANMAETVYDSLKGLEPDECSVEMNIGFKGKGTAIPFIAGGEMQGGIKVTATWKKESE